MKCPLSSGSASVLSVGFLLLLLAFSAFFFWLWYERYLSIEFNELGRYYDAEAQMVYTDAAFIWCFPVVVFLFLAALTYLAV